MAASPTRPPLVWSYVRTALRKIRGEGLRLHQHRRPGRRPGLFGPDDALGPAKKLSFDRFRAHRDSIYRLVTETSNPAERHASTPGRPRRSARSSRPEVPEVVGLLPLPDQQDSYGLRLRRQGLCPTPVIGIADPSFFTMFTFPFLKGDPKTALDEPRSIVDHAKAVARNVLRRRRPHGQVPDAEPGPLATSWSRASFGTSREQLHIQLRLP
ncbi:MAG: hypothetical protein MZU79_04635 [Anaerotruncus sp.]|nr:hypothetical protein [Anaerotruncus sp.]